MPGTLHTMPVVLLPDCKCPMYYPTAFLLNLQYYRKLIYFTILYENTY